MVNNSPKVHSVVITILVITRNVFNTFPGAVVTSIGWNWRIAESHRFFDSSSACTTARAPAAIKLHEILSITPKMKNVRLPIAPTTVNWNDITTILGNAFSFIAPAVKKSVLLID